MNAPLIATHGGPDAGPTIEHDFSTNANPLGPPPQLRRAVLEADRTRYPDPQYLTLRARLADAQDTAAARIVPASGGAEAIRRLTLAALLEGIAGDSGCQLAQPGASGLRECGGGERCARHYMPPRPVLYFLV